VSKTILKIFSDSVFQAEQEYVLFKDLSSFRSPEIQLYKNYGKKQVFGKPEVFSIFRTEGSIEIS
jgi:hypothetical protein